MEEIACIKNENRFNYLEWSDTIHMYIKKERNILLILSILMICIGVLLPISKPLYNSIGKIIETNNFDMEVVGEIVEGTKIEQKIDIPKGLNQYGVMFATYIRNNTGHIEVKIEQDITILKEVIDISTLEDNQNYMFKMDINKLQKGNAKLIITGLDGTPGNAVTVYASKDTSLGRMSLNGNELNKGIMQQFKFNEFNSISLISIVLSGFLILLGGYVVYILNFTKEDRKNSIILFLCTIAISIIILCIKAPILTFNVEPFAELATNYYMNAETYGFFKNIPITDAGYLPLLQRLVSLFVVKVLHASPVLAISLMQGFAIVFITSISSMFCLKEFSEYGDRLFRFTISIILGTFAIVYVYYDSHSFINFTYYGLIWIILISMTDLNTLSKKKFIGVLFFTSLICISKSYYVLLIPIVVFIYILKRKEMSKRYKYYLGGILLASCIQLIYTARNIQQWVKPEEKPSNLFDIIQKSVYNVVQQVIYLVHPNIANVPDVAILNIVFLLVVIIVVMLSIYYIYILKNNKNLVLLSLIFLVFGSSMFNVITTVWNQKNDWFRTQGALITRHSLFIQIGIMFILVLGIYMIRQICENLIFNEKDTKLLTGKKDLKQYFRWVYFFIAFILVSRFAIFENKGILSNDISFSDWKSYSSMLKEERYVIPIDPYPWMLRKNCDLYLIGKPDMLPKVETNQILDGTIKQINQVKFDKKIKIVSIFAKRLRNNNQDKLFMIGYNENNEPITKVMQVNKSDKMYIGFILKDTAEISKISFFNENMEQEYVAPEIIIGMIN